MEIVQHVQFLTELTFNSPTLELIVHGRVNQRNQVVFLPLEQANSGS